MNIIPILFLVIAVYQDVKEKKIKNHLTYPMILLGIVANIYFSGEEGFFLSVGGILLSFFITSFIPGFRYGGGDIKLSMGIGSFLGPSKTMYFLFFMLFLSCLICTIKFIKTKGLINFKNRLVEEILSIRVDTENIANVTGAPIILFAYIATQTFLKGW